MVRRVRTPATWLTLVALLFAQLAVAAHACAVELRAMGQPAAWSGPAVGYSGAHPDGHSTGAPTGRAAADAHADCPDALWRAAEPPANDADGPLPHLNTDAALAAQVAQATTPLHGNLCQAHCQYGASSVDTAGGTPTAAPPSSLLLNGLVLPAPVDADFRRTQRYADALAPPPPTLLFGVLRI